MVPPLNPDPESDFQLFGDSRSGFGPRKKWNCNTYWGGMILALDPYFQPFNHSAFRFGSSEKWNRKRSIKSPVNSSVDCHFIPVAGCHRANRRCRRCTPPAGIAACWTWRARPGTPLRWSTPASGRDQSHHRYWRVFNSPILDLHLRFGILICKLWLKWGGPPFPIWNPFWTPQNWILKCEFSWNCTLLWVFYSCVKLQHWNTNWDESRGCWTLSCRPPQCRRHGRASPRHRCSPLQWLQTCCVLPHFSITVEQCWTLRRWCCYKGAFRIPVWKKTKR